MEMRKTGSLQFRTVARWYILLGAAQRALNVSIRRTGRFEAPARWHRLQQAKHRAWCVLHDVRNGRDLAGERV